MILCKENCLFRPESESHSVMSDSLRPQGLYSPWNSPGQNTGMGSLSLLQGIFPTQGSNPGLLHCRRILYHLNHKVSLLGLGSLYREFFKIMNLILLFEFERVQECFFSGVKGYPFFFWMAGRIPDCLTKHII